MDGNFYTKDRLHELVSTGLVTVGDYTYGCPKVLHWNDKTILCIGKYCSISDDVTIILGGNHRPDWVTTYPFSALSNDWPEAENIEGHPATKGDIVIGNDVWIGYGATILSGVTIGDGAVVGAKAVVSKDVSPYAIVVGNPAQEVKKRFDEEMISVLLERRWWDWPEERVRSHMGALLSIPTKNI